MKINIDAEIGKRMIAMAQKEKEMIDNKIRYNRAQIKKYSDENTVFKRQRKPLTDIINDWYKAIK